jgi:drug/metabolite transporter (DMT)-like permease
MPVAAILLMVASGIIFSLVDAVAKYLVLAGVPSPFAAWVRFFVNALLVVVVFRAWRPGSGLVAHSMKAQIARACFICVTTTLNFMALQTLQLAETMSIMFLQPMVITALAGPLLGEWAGWRRWMAIGIGLVGVLVITRPGLGVVGVGHLYALGAMFMGSLFNLMTRSLSATETPQSLILYQSLIPSLLLIPAVPLYGVLPPQPLYWLFFFAMGVGGFLGHWLFIKANRLAKATSLAPFFYLHMIWMLALGWAVFDQFPDLWTLVGSGIIVASGLYILQRERRLRIAARLDPA